MKIQVIRDFSLASTVKLHNLKRISMKVLMAVLSIFFHISVYSQQILDLAKTLHWEGSTMAGAKATLDDSCLIKCTEKRIVMENMFTAKQRQLYTSDKNIRQFDIDEKAGLLAIIFDTGELLLYDYLAKTTVKQRVLLGKIDSCRPTLSPSGRKLMLAWPKHFVLSPTNEFTPHTNFGPDSIIVFDNKLQLQKTIYLEGDLVKAEYLDDENIVLILSQRDRMRIFNYRISDGVMEELIAAGRSEPEFTIDRNNQVVAILYGSQIKLLKKIENRWTILTLANASLGFWNHNVLTLSKYSDHFFIIRDHRTLQIWQNSGTVPQLSLKFSNPHPLNDDRIRRIVHAGAHIIVAFDDGETFLYKLPVHLSMAKKKQNQVDLINQRLGNITITAMSYSQENMVLSFSDMGGNIYLYDLNLRKKVKEIKLRSAQYKFKLHPVDNSVLYINNPSLICLDYKKEIKRELYNGYVSDFDVSPNGKLVAFAPYNERQIQIVDYSTARLYKKYEVPLDEREHIGKIYFDNNGQGIVVTTNRTTRFGDDLAVLRMEVPYQMINDFRIFYCRPRDSLFREVASFGSEPKIAFSPDSKYIAVSNQSTNIYVYDLTRHSYSSRYISVTGCKTPQNLLQQNTEKDPQVIAQPFFFNDSIIGLTDYTSSICRYNVKQHSFIDPLKVEDSADVYTMHHPVAGNYYFQLDFPREMNDKTGREHPRRIEVKMKKDHKTVFTLENSYTDFAHALFARENKILMASRNYAQMFDISKLSIDTVYDLESASLDSKMKMDTMSGLLIYADYGRTTELFLDTSTDWTRGYFNTRDFDSKIEDFVVDLRRGLLGIVYSVYGSQNLEFWLIDVRNPDRRKSVLLRNYRKAVFGSLGYDQKSGTFYIAYRSASNEEYEIEKLTRNDFTGRYTYSKKILPNVVEFTDMHVDEARNRIYLMAVGGSSSALQLINCSSLKVERMFLFTTKCLNMISEASGHRLLIGDSHGYIHFFNKNTYHINSIEAHEGEIRSLSLSKGGKLLSMGSEGAIKYWKAKDMSLIGSLHFLGKSEFMFVNRDGYYYSTKNGLSAIAFRSGNDVIPAEQLDLHFNRPDIVLKQLDSLRNVKTIKLYEMALRKRRNTYHNKGVFSFNQSNRPQVQFKNVSRDDYTLDSSRLRLNIEAADRLFALKTLQIWINNVPLYPNAGLRLDKKPTRKKDFNIDVVLNEGQNKIEVSSTNIKNVESVRAVRWITYTAAQGKKYQPRLYLYTIAVNKYKNHPAFNLRYALNDGRGLKDYFSQNYKGEIITDSFYNSKATKEALLVIKSRLKKTNVDDKVVILFSGHGTLDKSTSEFYFGSYDINFKKPSAKGISFRDIEELMNNIPSRKKLILIDACHSGLYDAKVKTITPKADTIHENGQNAVIRNAGKIGKTANEIERKSFELMQEIFWNVEKSDGTFVMTASAGDSYAIEMAGINNGIFIYAFLNALKSNEPAKLSIKQLSNIVTHQVSQITKGRQNPQLRKEFIDSDWNIIQ